MNRHKKILDVALPVLEENGYKATVFHHHTRMPKSLKGVPDLYLMHTDLSMWIEIKPLYDNYMRDQVSSIQWQWFHDRIDLWNPHHQYAIVGDKDELLFVALEYQPDIYEWSDNAYYIPEYHRGRYEAWKQGR
jgi:hypothetical protein